MPADVTSPLRLLCWEGYEQRQVLEPFEARHTVTVEAQTLISDAATAQSLVAGPVEHDVLNINNAYVAKRLHPARRVLTLDEDRFESAAGIERLARWTRSEDGNDLLGICQRYGTFNLVINEHLVSRARAEDEGFNLADDTSVPYGVLRYEDFNIFHVCIASGLNPFVSLTAEDIVRFERVARSWFTHAALVSEDHRDLNRALVDREIAYYLSGGVFTASPARLAGRSEVVAVTPRAGPIGGRGAIAFAEITCALARGSDDALAQHPLAERFLDYLLEPETALQVAFTENTCNPVAQMADPRIMARLSAKQLAAIQWGTLEEDMAACAMYDIVPDHGALQACLRDAIV